MSELDLLRLASAKSRGKRPWFLDDPAVEKVLSVTMSVATELAVARERIDTLERLLDARGVLKREDIEAYEPDAAAMEFRGQWHQEYLARLFRIIQQELETLDPASEPDYENVARQVSDPET